MCSRIRTPSPPTTLAPDRRSGTTPTCRSRFRPRSTRSRRCWRSMRFSVRAPASTANLGPGFDALGLALDLWNSVELETGGEDHRVSYEGADAIGMDGNENYSL